ncbi:cupin domain-containing protein [Undibacterium flavidum]|uniref:Cupin type-2 domain-containing protein n=1 Tax=Undibacterium flavidum TaxID=2762297 RepID=A0ABR6YDS3_9BURK|nr:cupin domain-containing protein [Undibacterium flavidum]MBC3874711.1 hypothetical protein [Undibacterium flavidum]
MAISHLSSGQVCPLLPSSVAIDNLQSIALFKDPHLEVIRMILPVGKSIPPHHVRGAMTIQCLIGEVLSKTDQQEQVLRTGDLQYLAGGVEHQLHANQDSALLVTICLLS